MRRWGRIWFGLDEPVDRATYAASGLGLAVFKYAVEALVIGVTTGHRLTPLEFVSPSIVTRMSILEQAPQWLGLALALWTVPFVWIALSMSLRRAYAAGLSPWLGTLVLLAPVNFVVMAILAFLPDARPTAGSATDPVKGDRLPGPLGSTQPGMFAVMASLAVGAVSLASGLYVFHSYGGVLFFGTPLVMGMVSGYVFNRPVSRSIGATLKIGLLVMLLAGGVLLVFALEGIICLVMAVPIVMPMALAGAILGKWVADCTSAVMSQLVGVVLAIPFLAGAEALTRQIPERVVLTTVEVDAPPEVVWQRIVEFPDLPAPTDWFFRCGIACPMRARIEGTGVGAVRHCEFSTGDFVEPITAWEEPVRLAFDVVDQPDPMVELTPWRHVHPPHLEDRSLESQRGEFRLIDLGDGRTRLEGRTWYTFDMHPQIYWTLWSDFSIHRIHRRVLDHIKRLAEADAAAGLHPRPVSGP
ncbi:MAG: SRPBCC family protein [Planctomycetia bacterium]|nr:SRPBCC family protein [Planctomycetia bacterium]